MTVAFRPKESLPAEGEPGHPWWHRLWERGLDHYPDSKARYFYLGVVVLSAIILYYELFVQAAVTPDIMAQYHMTFNFFVYMIVACNAIGAMASVLAGLSDRWGRANISVYGLFVTASIVLFGMPNAPNLWVYAVLYCLLGVVEGIILVSTPALIRDFSPQLGRASAMGFWTMGPVIASLTVAMVSSHTLDQLTAWQDQFIICGITGMVVFVIALFGLRELSPGLRDQLMVSIHDRELLEARAAGIDVDETLAHPWRQMAHADIIAPALGIGVFLIIFYTLISFFVPFMVFIFNYTQQRANALGNWVWAINAVALVLVGLLSDRVRVRKPFMVAGAIMAVAGTLFFAERTTHAGTGYYTFVWILCLTSVGLGFTFTTWLAAFTETVEARNPALMATGLAIWGLFLRLVVAGSMAVLPFVVTSMTNAAEAAKVQVNYPQQVETLRAIDPVTQARLLVNRSDAAAITTAVAEISRSLDVAAPEALRRLLAVSQVPSKDLATLQQAQRSQKSGAEEWQRWWWVCAGAEALLVPFVFLMKGRWNPKRAKKDEVEHEHKVEEELAKLAA